MTSGLQYVFLVALFSWLTGCTSSDFVSSGSMSNDQESSGAKIDGTEGTDQAPQVVPQDGGGEAESDGTGVEGGEAEAGDDNPNDLVEDDDAAPKHVPKFGLLVNDLRCALCHVKINGDVVSTSNVEALWNGSKAVVNGAWFAAEGFDAAVPSPTNGNLGSSVVVDVVGGVKTQYRGPELPKDRSGDGNPDFPVLDTASLPGKMFGTVKDKTTEIKKVSEGPAVLVGTAADPIVIDGEVLIKGDLVIKGVYKGIGNIYATGNIYIPADLKAQNSAFPFPTVLDDALAHAKQAIQDKKDALGLATPKSIFISDIEDHGGGNSSVFEHPLTPDGRKAAQLGVLDIYTWFPGGKAAYDLLYEDGAIDCNSGKPDNGRSINLIEAYLYAGNTIGGRANRNSYAINGGIMADHFHIISAARDCSAGTHPVHGYDQQWSHVNYDFRLRSGLLLLKQLAPNFD